MGGGALRAEADQRWHGCSETGKRVRPIECKQWKGGKARDSEGGVGHRREFKGIVDGFEGYDG